MANELVLNADPGSESGLTVTADVYGLDGVAVDTAITMTEVGSTAIYRGDMPSASAGTYLVRYFSGGALIARQTLPWDGSAEITLQTLDAAINAVSTAVGNVDTDISTLSAQVAALDPLTAQEVRDAMQLTATDGARSIDRVLQEVEDLTAIADL